MTTLNDILFDVEKVKVTEFACNSDYSNDIFVYPTIKGKTTKLRVNSCSDRYELVQNSEIFPNVRQVLQLNGIQFTESYEMINYSRFYGKYVITDKRFAYRVQGSSNDIIQPMLSVQHSYNGLTKYKINLGYFRLICSNGLVIPVKEMKEYNLSIQGKHTKAIKESFAKLDSTLKYFVNNAAQITSAITAKYDQLSGNMVTNIEDRITEVLNVINVKAKKQSGEYSDIYNTVINTIDKERHQYNNKVNDWLIYNAVNAHLFNSDLKASPETQSEKDGKVFEYLLTH